MKFASDILTIIFLISIITFYQCPLSFCIHLGKNGYPKFPVPVLSCGRRITHWRPDREPKVVGGEETPHGAAPWQVALRHHGKLRCGAVLISSRIVLTAAHCYIDGMVAVAGANDQYEEGSSHRQRIRVENGIVHPDYKKLGPYSFDIAVLILETPGFKLNEQIKPVCLTQETPNPGTWCELSGWGSQDPRAPGRPSNILRSAAIPVLALETCRTSGVYGGRYQPILDNMICAGHLKGGIDACGGDSGSPLVCESHGKYELVGLVSWGDGCAKKNRPGVYTNVPSFLDWIRETASNNNVAVL